MDGTLGLIMDKIAPEELRKRKGQVKMFDIRQNPDARRIPSSVQIEGAALERGDDVPFGKDEDVVLYCGSGNSCSRIAQSLHKQGYRVAALDGGYKAWVEAGLPTEERPAG